MPTSATTRRTPETIPDDRVLGEYEAGSRVTFFLKATMPVFTVLVQGGNNVSFQVRRPYEWPIGEIAGKPRVYNVRIAGKVQVSGLAHTRAAGALVVGVAFSVASITRTRTLGSLSVSIPPVIPPDPGPGPSPDPTPHSTLSGGPRSIRGVRRRDTKHR